MAREAYAKRTPTGVGTPVGEEFTSSASDARDLAAAEKERGIDPDNVNTHPRNYTDAEWDRRRYNLVAAPGLALERGIAGALMALEKAYEELSTNKNLAKGAEFGFRAAGEVTKDVVQKTAEKMLSIVTEEVVLNLGAVLDN